LYGAEEMDRKVQESCIRVVPLQCITNAGSGTRIRLVTTEEFEYQKRKEETRVYGSGRRFLSAGYDENPIHEGPGVVLSWWLVEQHLHPHTILPSTTDLFQECYGKGFGSRDRSKNLGLNLYTGKRMSDMKNPSPIEGPGQARQGQYFRNNYVSLLQPQVEKLINSLSTAASVFGRRGDPTTNFFFSPKDKRTPCAVKIVTAGQSKARNRWKQVLAFANSPHVDAFDEYDANNQEAFLHLLDDSMAKVGLALDPNSTDLSYASSSAQYLHRFFDRVRFGTPCTCAYQHVLHPSWSSAVLYQFFMLDGMGHCVRLENNIGHQFYAHTFVHRTSLCLSVFEGRVYFLSSDGLASVFAWGEGGNPVGTRAPANPRRRRKRAQPTVVVEEEKEDDDEEEEEEDDEENKEDDNEDDDSQEGKSEDEADDGEDDDNEEEKEEGKKDGDTSESLDPSAVQDTEIHLTQQASSGGALSQAAVENPLFPFLSPPSFSPPISPPVTNTIIEKAAQTTTISANEPIAGTKPPPANAPVEGTEPRANAPLEGTEPAVNAPVQSTEAAAGTEPQHPGWDEAIAMAIDIHATATHPAAEDIHATATHPTAEDIHATVTHPTTAITEAPQEAESPEAVRNLMEDLNRAQDPIDLDPSISPTQQLTPEDQLTPMEESIPLQVITPGGSYVSGSLLQSVGMGTRSRPTQQETVGGSSREVAGETRASSGGAPGGVPGGFQFGGDAPIAQKKKKGTRPRGALKKPPPPPSKEQEPDIDLQQGNHHYFYRNLMSLATNPVEQTRNFSAFGIPEDKYYLSENLGDGNCLFYVWMQFFHLLKAERKYSNLSRRHISETIFLRKLVWDLAGEGLFKDNMLKKDDLVCYLLGGDAETTTEEGLIDQYRVSLIDDVWENLREAVYNKDLMYKDWEELKITWKPHPDFPKDPLKFDPEFFSVLHDTLQPSACFVGPFFMERYAHLHFRVIAFFLQVYRLGKEGEYPPPNEIYLHIMDARDGPPVKYSVIHNGQFDPTMDDGRTLFMFVDTQHVNSMYRKTDAWQIEEYHRKEAEQSASLRKEARKKKRADRPT
jgi:hypothetical protein